MKKKHLLGSIIISTLLIIPVFASAATVDEMRAQIQTLLQQIEVLQAQLNTLTTGTSVTTPTTSASCPNLYRPLYRGVRGNDVASLQQFLRSTGDFTYPEITNYYGPATEAAIQRWQARNGIVSSGDAASTGYGVVGPRTRVAIATRCAKITTITDSPVTHMFSAVPTSGPAPLTVAFTGSVSASYFGGVLIEYGDGTKELFCDPGGRCFNNLTHTYAKAGTYTAKIVGVGEEASTTLKTIVVLVNTPQQPAGSLNALPTSGTAPLKITFTATANAGFFGGVLVDFGDGNKEIVLRPGGSQKNGTISHEYVSPGTYTAQLIGIGEGGNTILDTSIVSVSASPVAKTFSATPTSGPAPLTVAFTGFPSGAINFGDGVSRDFQDYVPPSTTYTYEKAGVYTATTYGGSAVITVADSTPTPSSSYSLIVTPTAGTAPLTVKFVASGKGSFFGGVLVDFGDGNKEIVLRPGGSQKNGTISHEYVSPGTYTAQLIGIGEGGNRTLDTATITITEDPTGVVSPILEKVDHHGLTFRSSLRGINDAEGVVLCFHGRGGSAKGWSSEGQEEKSQFALDMVLRNNWAVVCPTSLDRNTKQWDNTNNTNNPDVKNVDSLLNTLGVKSGTPLLLVGHSNGGGFASRYAVFSKRAKDIQAVQYSNSSGISQIIENTQYQAPTLFNFADCDPVVDAGEVRRNYYSLVRRWFRPVDAILNDLDGQYTINSYDNCHMFLNTGDKILDLLP